ncbi:putative altronate dehydratase [Halanaerobium saccharolyticum subsp. saccharolyticum DSM 6643]|uniref:Putative altronate dehydratase n=1 Tax=Halanaerobium saccharolyticum subsp. saccharolyticum DSM 6643 TaxID=1293054 RepID=M5E011_9FIRM|nr:UxaA family hydrolase [Halanaerobium saccharolyticum]CCU78945.1 putative altronate dehydratase [Halanaerobium saccharolyticum subsp. saccharolyticum DSM 6643]
MIKISEINILKISEKDNVAVLLSDVSKGDYYIYNDKKYELKEDIKFGHKAALNAIKEDEEIIKYGEIIAYAKEDISAGTWIHNHNIISDRGRLKAGDDR